MMCNVVNLATLALHAYVQTMAGLLVGVGAGVLLLGVFQTSGDEPTAQERARRTWTR